MKPVSVQVVCQLQYLFHTPDGVAHSTTTAGQVPVTVARSSASKPMIITTNSNQWMGTSKILLEVYVFGTEPTVGTLRFFNLLQKFFLIATQQNPTAPARVLSRRDYNYILGFKVQGGTDTQFPGMAVVDRKAFADFWSWFGESVTKLTHRRHLLPLWTQGLLLGFLSTEEADQLLRGQPDGTFLVRFSNNYSGELILSYKAEGQASVRHYLIQEVRRP